MKTHAPAELTQWREDNRDANHDYASLKGSAAHQALKSALLGEQGYLCAYTGRSISGSTSHVEHLKPQNQCFEWEDVEYRNVVACFPADGGDISHGYGAPVKAGQWNEETFVSPLDEECERRFGFSWSGHVYPQPDDHVAARETIKALGLENEVLRGLRKSRIYGFFGLGAKSRSNPLSIPDARRALENIDRLDNSGRLIEFCFVLKQLLPKYIEQGGRQ